MGDVLTTAFTRTPGHRDATSASTAADFVFDSGRLDDHDTVRLPHGGGLIAALIEHDAVGQLDRR